MNAPFLKKLIFSVCFLLGALIFAQSQQDMNKTASDNYAKADQELNAVYTKIKFKYKEDKIFLKNLKSSQLLWIKFRDAEMLMKYPGDGQNTYGSIFPMCFSMYKQNLTEQRTTTLKQWLNKHEDGDACSGSLQ